MLNEWQPPKTEEDSDFDTDEDLSDDMDIHRSEHIFIFNTFIFKLYTLGSYNYFILSEPSYNPSCTLHGLLDYSNCHTDMLLIDLHGSFFPGNHSVPYLP